MSKRLLSSCPYCGKKMSYIGLMLLKRKGEHYCYKCKCTSNVVLSRGLFALASAVCVIGFLIMLLFSMFGNHEDLRGMLWVIIPFAVFYVSIPFFVKLEPFNDKIYKQKRVPRTARIIKKPQPAVSSAAPVQLDVEEDFSKKFMQAKNNASQKMAETIQEETNKSQ